MPTGQPSLQPVSRPSIRPSAQPTSAPTSSNGLAVPYIYNMTVAPGQNNVTIRLQLRYEAFSGKRTSGTIYCAAFPTGSVPTSTVSVVSRAVRMQYMTATDPLGHTVVVSGLTALTPYTAYVFIDVGNGYAMSFSAVLGTKHAFTTTCCMSVYFTNAPVSVRGDVSTYTSNLGVPSFASFVFSYALEAIPNRTASVVVTPRFYASNGTFLTSAVRAVPSSVTFKAGMSQAQLSTLGVFYISATTAFTGTVNMVMTTNSNQYQNTTTTIHIVNANTPMNAPQLQSAVFAASGAFFSVIFNVPTDQAGITRTKWPCTKLFNFTGSSAATCTWINASAVTASFGTLVQNVNYLTPGQMVHTLMTYPYHS